MKFVEVLLPWKCAFQHFASLMVFWCIPGKNRWGADWFWHFRSCRDITELLSFTRGQQKVTGLWVLVEENLFIQAREGSPLPNGNERDWKGHFEVTSARVSVLITPKSFWGGTNRKRESSRISSTATRTAVLRVRDFSYYFRGDGHLLNCVMSMTSMRMAGLDIRKTNT